MPLRDQGVPVRLTDQEVAELWTALKGSEREAESAAIRMSTGSGKTEAILESLVRHYEPLAKFLARRALAKAPAHQSAEDLISSAHQGLLDAIQRFEPDRGLKFETYASRRIAGAIVDGQRKDDPLTRSARKRVNSLRDAQRDLWSELGRQPTVGDLAASMGVDELAVRELLVQQQTLTKELDGAAEEVVGTSLTDDLELESLSGQSRLELAERLARLTERDRIFVLLYYVEHLTLREIGARFGCSDSRCAQIRKEVMTELLAA